LDFERMIMLAHGCVSRNLTCDGMTASDGWGFSGLVYQA